jgi:hypothetical protein
MGGGAAMNRVVSKIPGVEESPTERVTSTRPSLDEGALGSFFTPRVNEVGD